MLEYPNASMSNIRFFNYLNVLLTCIYLDQLYDISYIIQIATPNNKESKVLKDREFCESKWNTMQQQQQQQITIVIISGRKQVQKAPQISK
jgi:hypothetical protein